MTMYFQTVVVLAFWAMTGNDPREGVDNSAQVCEAMGEAICAYNTRCQGEGDQEYYSRCMDMMFNEPFQLDETCTQLVYLDQNAIECQRQLKSATACEDWPPVCNEVKTW